jgi:PAS domain S-box-containing protein
MRVAFESAPNGAVIVDEAGAILQCNVQIERLFGYARQELIGQSIEMLLPERFRQVHQFMRLGFVADSQTRLMGKGRSLLALRKDGAEFPVEIGLNPVVMAEGVVILASIIDISARMADEAALRDSEERLRAVMEHVVDGVVTIDERGIVQSANPAVERLFGYTAAELLGRNIALLMPEPFRGRHDMATWRTISPPARRKSSASDAK